MIFEKKFLKKLFLHSQAQNCVMLWKWWKQIAYSFAYFELFHVIFNGVLGESNTNVQTVPGFYDVVSEIQYVCIFTLHNQPLLLRFTVIKYGLGGVRGYAF